MKTKKIIFFLIDGLADPAGPKTPLALARSKNIGQRLNRSFLSWTLPLNKSSWPKDGYASVSQDANLGLLGYSVKKIHVRRGPIEAIGSEIAYKNSDLAFRIDFGSVDASLKIIDRRAGRNNWGVKNLVADLNKMPFLVPFRLYSTYGHRGVLVFKSDPNKNKFKLSDQISNADPLSTNKKVLPIKPLVRDKNSIKTADLVQSFLSVSHDRLDRNPFNQKRLAKKLFKINFLLARGGGVGLPRIKNFFQRFNFKSGLVVAENGVIKGTCELAGFKTFTVPELKKESDQLEFIFKAVLNNQVKAEITYVHLKTADEASHDKNPEKKKMFFEKFDLAFGQLVKKLNLDDFIFVITGDHITNSKTGQHQFGPVPIIFFNNQIKSNRPRAFSEKEALRFKQIKNDSIWRYLKNLSL